MTNEVQPGSNLPKKLSIKIFGVGGAGGNIVEQLGAQSIEGAALIAVNTDSRALDKCRVPEKVVLGAKLTRGLGAGGDPDMARAAARDDIEKLKSLCAGADVVFITAGLGGGTGTGASSVLAQVAKEAGALVIAMVTLPFDFEGSRRFRQSQLGLRDLKAAADSVICLPNQKVFKLINDDTSVLETFNASNGLIVAGIRGMWRMMTQTGLINVDFADLCAVTKGRGVESYFAAIEASGPSCGSKAVEMLLAHPLLEGGVLDEADSLLVSIAGGSDLAMSEVRKVMERINEECKGAHITFGAVIDESFAGKLALTLVISNRSEESEAVSDRGVKPTFSDVPERRESFDAEDIIRKPSRFVPPAPVLGDDKKQQLITRHMRGSKNRKSGIGMRQGQLPLEIVSKGRFEKSEPTIHDGKDLDVPTYVRWGVSLN